MESQKNETRRDLQVWYVLLDKDEEFLAVGVMGLRIEVDDTISIGNRRGHRTLLIDFARFDLGDGPDSRVNMGGVV